MFLIGRVDGCESYCHDSYDSLLQMRVVLRPVMLKLPMIPGRILTVVLIFVVLGGGLMDRLVWASNRNTLALQVMQMLVKDPGCRPELLNRQDVALESDTYLDKLSMDNACNGSLGYLTLSVRPSRIAGIMLIAQAKYTLAENVLLQTSEYNRNDAFVRYLLGIAAWRHGDRVSARSFWQGTGAERLWIAQAWACAVQNDPCALSFANIALSVSPSDVEVIRDVGRYAEAQGRIDQAIAAYSRVLTMNCQSFACEMLLGHMYRLQFRWEDAINHYERASQLNPRSGEPYYALARVYSQLCDLPRAFRVAEQGQLADPGFGWNAFFLQQFTTGPEKLEYDRRCTR